MTRVSSTPSPTSPAQGAHFFDRAAKEAFEDQKLAPWAMKSGASLGRHHPEEEDDLRTAWERDRDRIVHSLAFRRLMYKTQVFVNWEGDHYRTRLSHSLEVAQVARSVGSALFLNEPLCEGIALAHDIGHPPFGHRGEVALDHLMAEHGGFRHNNQVLRVVDLLERRSPDYPGLNLTRELRESLLKHETDAEWPTEFRPRPLRPCLEAQVVDLADSTAYHVHDIEDGLRSQIFTEDELDSVAIWQGAKEAVELRHPGFLTRSTDVVLRVKRVCNELIKILINDLIHASHASLEAERPASPAEVKSLKKTLIEHSPPIAKEVAELNRFLYDNFYRRPRLDKLTEHAAEVLRELFEAYRQKPEELGPWFQDWRREVGDERAACDYIAGMTDRFAEDEYERLTGKKTLFANLRR